MKSACGRVFEFTARTLKTARPVPFGALIVETRTGERLMRATNAVLRENDPSAHAETRTVRLACKKLKRPSLAGFTMYSTCEPCPMCMANALWARLDRVVFGATIEDANRYCLQIHISAKEVARRSDMPCVVDGPVSARFVQHAFHASQHAEGVSDLEHEQEQVQQTLNFGASQFLWTRSISLNFVY